ncbi:MAG: acetolactate synthase small subunit [Planctomycetota bacterium]|jgi:acetolactate synthase-1/3 small subunit
MRHVISALVQNRPGVLSHVAGLFSSRGFNIDSLTVGETEAAGVSRMTIVARGDEGVLEQIRKQLGKLINVVKVYDFSRVDYVERDLCLIKLHAPSGKKPEIILVGDAFQAKVVDITRNELMFEVTGPEAKINACIDTLRPYGLKEVVRTGRIAMARGPKMEGALRDGAPRKSGPVTG